MKKPTVRRRGAGGGGDPLYRDNLSVGVVKHGHEHGAMLICEEIYGSSVTAETSIVEALPHILFRGCTTSALPCKRFCFLERKIFYVDVDHESCHERKITIPHFPNFVNKFCVFGIIFISILSI